MWYKLFFGLLLILAAAAGGAKAWIEHSLNAELRRAAAKLPPGTLTYEQAFLTPLAQVELTGGQLRLPDYPPLAIEQVVVHEVYRFHRRDRLPDTLRADARVHFELPAAESGQVPILVKALGYGDYYLTGADWARLGYRRLSAEVTLHLRRDAARQQLNLALTVDSQALGRVEITLILDNVPRLTPRIFRQLTGLPVRSLQLRYHGGDLLQRLAAYLANRNQTQAALLREQLATKVGRDLQPSGLTSENLSALQHFLRQGQVLEIHLTPPRQSALKNLLKQAPGRWLAGMVINSTLSH